MKRLLLTGVVLLGASAALMGQNYTIKTVAGVPPTTQTATAPNNLTLNTPTGVLVTADGSVYIADIGTHKVWKIDPNGVLSVWLGTGVAGSPTDGKAAAGQQVSAPYDFAMDTAGNIYVSDAGNNQIYQIDTSGVLHIIAGASGNGRYSGDGRSAVRGEISSPRQIVWYKSALYIADRGNNRIRKISGGNITTVAGGGTSFVEGGVATLAKLSNPEGVAFDSSGNMYIADTGNNRIRKVDTSGNITTLAGRDLTNQEQGKNPDGTAIRIQGRNLSAASAPFAATCASFSGTPVNSSSRPTSACATVGDGRNPLDALLASPADLVVDSSGNLIIADRADRRIRQISANGSAISTIAGSASSCSASSPCGDSGAASLSTLNNPTGLNIDSSGRLVIADSGALRIRAISSGVISSITGFNSFNGDQAALKTLFLNPLGIASDTAGNLYISDTGNNRIRKIDTAGNVTTLAGAGNDSDTEGISPLAAKLNSPTGIAVDPSGATIYFSDSGTGRIRKVTSGTINTVVSGGSFGITDSSDAKQRRIAALALDAAGNLYFTDPGNNSVWMLTADSLTQLAGCNCGTTGAAGDGGPALNALFNRPSGIAVKKDGSVIFVADTQNQTVRAMQRDSSGAWIILPVAGDYSAGSDGSSTTIAYNRRLRRPAGLALNSAEDTLYIAVAGNQTIRSVNLSTLVGTILANSSRNGDDNDFVPFYAGDNVSANDSSVNLAYPEDLTVDASGNVFFVDSANNVVRELVAPAPSK